MYAEGAVAHGEANQGLVMQGVGLLPGCGTFHNGAGLKGWHGQEGYGQEGDQDTTYAPRACRAQQGKRARLPRLAMCAATGGVMLWYHPVSAFIVGAARGGLGAKVIEARGVRSYML